MAADTAWTPTADESSAAHAGDLSRLLRRLDGAQRLTVGLDVPDVAARAAGLRFLLQRIHPTHRGAQTPRTCGPLELPRAPRPVPCPTLPLLRSLL